MKRSRRGDAKSYDVSVKLFGKLSSPLLRQRASSVFYTNQIKSLVSEAIGSIIVGDYFYYWKKLVFYYPLWDLNDIDVSCFMREAV